MTPNDTICALATATGGAIVIIRLSGPKAIDITNRIFNKNLNEAQPNTIHFGRITDEEGEVVDEPLVSVFRAPHSYTGEDSTEISLHGSPYIAQRVLRLLLKHGARQALPGEFTQR
ncbi:MAG: tRNA uridine-5-carboxymethylaminomethyl(34) synthesis GTPase MnmE, partial [Bacteroidaceae bacterium]|nr:tRNA uridine-5-carboxymethylaminomethyl(34) synthesis GTPase MnmE [Bacteroidaceae bacterium]